MQIGDDPIALRHTNFSAAFPVLDRNQEENLQFDHIPFDLKEARIYFSDFNPLDFYLGDFYSRD